MLYYNHYNNKIKFKTLVSFIKKIRMKKSDNIIKNIILESHLL